MFSNEGNNNIEKISKLKMSSKSLSVLAQDSNWGRSNKILKIVRFGQLST
jgi:hypothetical protein